MIEIELVRQYLVNRSNSFIYPGGRGHHWHIIDPHVNAVWSLYLVYTPRPPHRPTQTFSLLRRLRVDHPGGQRPPVYCFCALPVPPVVGSIIRMKACFHILFNLFDAFNIVLSQLIELACDKTKAKCLFCLWQAQFPFLCKL